MKLVPLKTKTAQQPIVPSVTDYQNPRIKKWKKLKARADFVSHKVIFTKVYAV